MKPFSIIPVLYACIKLVSGSNSQENSNIYNYFTLNIDVHYNPIAWSPSKEVAWKHLQKGHILIKNLSISECDSHQNRKTPSSVPSVILNKEVFSYKEKYNIISSLKSSSVVEKDKASEDRTVFLNTWNELNEDSKAEIEKALHEWKEKNKIEPIDGIEYLQLELNSEILSFYEERLKTSPDVKIKTIYSEIGECIKIFPTFQNYIKKFTIYDEVKKVLSQNKNSKKKKREIKSILKKKKKEVFQDKEEYYIAQLELIKANKLYNHESIGVTSSEANPTEAIQTKNTLSKESEFLHKFVDKIDKIYYNMLYLAKLHEMQIFLSDKMEIWNFPMYVCIEGNIMGAKIIEVCYIDERKKYTVNRIVEEKDTMSRLISVQTISDVKKVIDSSTKLTK